MSNDSQVENNLEQQREEQLALEAIYGSEHYFREPDYDDAWLFVPETRYTERQLKLRIHIPVDYPAVAPPIIELLVPGGWLSREEQQHILDTLMQQYMPGEVVLFNWTAWLTEYLDEQCTRWEGEQASSKVERVDSPPRDTSTDQATMEESNEQSNDNSEPQHESELWPSHQIAHGLPIIDRKSTFLAHLAEIHSVDDKNRVINTLLMDRKIARATHNISAYRIILPSGHLLQDCDDDGETAAGGRLLHLLQIVDAQNVVVVVSRWYGGIQLGPDRFKHINNAARQLLATNGYINNNDTNTNAKSSTNKRSKK
ncbi:ribosomal protein S5 domain 2-type protein [Syncephalis plumigaleata]|nr:ribosomal protein S5 domain 2-type protein [Syncephalis plumigaleata]